MIFIGFGLSKLGGSSTRRWETLEASEGGVAFPKGRRSSERLGLHRGVHELFLPQEAHPPLGQHPLRRLRRGSRKL